MKIIETKIKDMALIFRKKTKKLPKGIENNKLTKLKLVMR